MRQTNLSINKRTKRDNNENRQLYFTIIFYVMAFILIFIINHFTVYTSDDYRYHFFYDGVMPHTPQREIHNLFDVFASQYNHYFMWNGRVLAHAFVQIMMQFPKWVFDIVSSLCFIALNYLMSIIVQTLTKSKFPLLLHFLTFIGLWLFLPLPSTSVYWLSGACNYLWMSLFYGVFFLFFLKHAYHKNSVFTVLVGVLFGFLAGMSSENSGPAVVIMILIWSFFYLDKFKGVHIWQWASMVAILAGSIFIIMSPASRKQADPFSFQLLALKINDVLALLQGNALWLIWLSFMILICGIAFGQLQRNDYVNVTVLMFGFLSSLFALSFVPRATLKVISGALRSYFGPLVFLMIMDMYLLERIYQVLPVYHVRKWLLSLSMSLIAAIALINFAISYSQAYSDIHRSYAIEAQNIQKIYRQKAEHKSVITIKKISMTKNPYNAVNYTVHTDVGTMEWFNQWMAHYYGVKAINGEN